MQQRGEYRIEAPREAVWRALNDPEILMQCIEGCESLTPKSDDSFEAVVRAKVGPLSAAFTGEIKIEDPNPPNAYTLRGAVKGGAAGFGKGSAKVTLSDAGAGATLLSYDVEGNVGGKLAQIGQRLIDATARKMADDFFAKFSEAVASPGKAALTQKSKSAIPAPVLWIGAGAALAVLIAYWLLSH